MISNTKKVVVIGGGPAGLMAAETIANAGWAVDLYDAMPSVGRKFLLAGKGGLNLTHAEEEQLFLNRFGSRQAEIQACLAAFNPDALRAWAGALGVDTFVGSSGRVFPTDMKAAPLLRAWLHRLRESGVRLHRRHRWLGWERGQHKFTTPEGDVLVNADATVLALGGASWARLGSDGAWVSQLEQQGVSIAPLQAANCGFNVAWSPYMKERFAGVPLNTVIATVLNENGEKTVRQGQFVISEYGVEGSLIYALSALLRDQITAFGQAKLYLDLLPGKDAAKVKTEVSASRGSKSLSSHLRSKLGVDAVKIALMYECLPVEMIQNPDQLARALKHLPLSLASPRPIDEAISTAGGVVFQAMDSHFMLRNMPGVFCAGEMLDWEAPTGGYLLTACFATGRVAGLGVNAWLASHEAL